MDFHVVWFFKGDGENVTFIGFKEFADAYSRMSELKADGFICGIVQVHI